jgi:mono/diheme cytochrome c family protein
VIGNRQVRQQASSAFALGPAKPAALVFDAKALYEKNCASCNGSDGMGGNGGLNVPNFKDAKWQQRHTDQQFIDAIAKGKGTMPAWKDKLAEEQMKSLAAYVRQFVE